MQVRARPADALSTAAMNIGDLVLHQGRRYYLRGLDPMSVPDRSRRSSRVPPEFERVPSGYDRTRGRPLMYEMVIYGVSFDLVGKQPIVLLKTAEGNKFLPIWIGHPEAAAILMKLQGASTPRPMTHDLVTDIIGQLDAQVVRITVTELKENTFYASITVQQNGSEIEIDSRPSDAIALAVRAEAPIFAAEEVIEESAIEFEGEDVNEEEIVTEFKQFLDQVTPDEFAEAPDEE
jgi:bifunctional DNase/RNase